MDIEKNHSQENQNPIVISDLGIDDKRNLVGFFALLIKVDKRVNPHLYSPMTSARKAFLQARLLVIKKKQYEKRRT
jgi:hypothetical protein